MSKFKEGDLDGNGKKIVKIYQQGTNSKGDFFIFYEDKEGKLKYGAKGDYHKKLVPLKNVISDLSQLTKRLQSFSLNKKGSATRHYYNGIIAGNISGFFSMDDFSEVEKRIELLKAEFTEEIKSLAKFNYIIQAGKVLIIIFLVALFFWLYETRLVDWNGLFIHFHEWFVNTIYLSAAGAIGAFISIVQKISNVNVDKFLPDLRTKLDASIRIILGAIFGNLLIWFIKADMFNLISKEALNFLDVNASLSILIVAVIGGFGERLVPSILSSKSQIKTN